MIVHKLYVWQGVRGYHQIWEELGGELMELMELISDDRSTE